MEFVIKNAKVKEVVKSTNIEDFVFKLKEIR